MPFHIESGATTQITNTFMIIASEEKALTFIPENENWKEIFIGNQSWSRLVGKEPASFNAFMIPDSLSQCSVSTSDKKD